MISQDIRSLQSLYNKYDVFLFDIWGVIHNGITLYPGIEKIFNELYDRNKKVALVSNTPRPQEVTRLHLNSMGFSTDRLSIFTSGDYTRHCLMSKQFSPFTSDAFYHMGASCNTDILHDIPVSPVDSLENADFVLHTAFADTDSEREFYIQELDRALERQLPLVCPNPDITSPKDSQSFRFCCGYFAHIYEKQGGEVIYCGKPHTAMFQWVYDGLSHEGFPYKEQYIMIGDTLGTDILGAQKFGIDSVLVSTGNGNKPANLNTYPAPTYRIVP